MRVYRIEREKYLKSTLQGIGASLSKGFRWNSLNTCMVYAAESRALAMLEIAVHLDISEDLPNDRYLVTIDIPDNIQILELDQKKLPKDWNRKPPMRSTQIIGDHFIQSNQSAILKVPSSIISEEFNFLINPKHFDIKKIKVISKKKIQIDQRLKFSI